MGKKGGHIALGLAQGVLQGMQLRREMDRDEEDKKARAEERQYRTEERDYVRGERQRVAGDRLALQNAAKPATVSESGALPEGLQFPSNEDAEAGTAMPAVPQFRLESGQGAQRFDTKQQADAAAAKHNDPGATSQRISLALAQQGKPVESMEFQSKADEFAGKRWRRKLGQALQGGFGGLETMINDSEIGPFQGKKVKLVPSEDGKNVTLHTLDEAGTPKPTQLTFTNDQKGLAMAGYMMDTEISPEVRYKHMVEEDKREAAQSAKEKELKLRERELNEVKIPNAETRAALAEVRAQLAEYRTKGGGRKDDGVSREERLRYTTLFTDAGRRMQDVQKALNTLRQDRQFMKRAATAGSPEAVQVQELQEQLTEHKDERETYRGLLGRGKDDGKGTSLSDAEKPSASKPPKATPAAKAPVKVTSKAERDKLAAGTRYVGPDGETYIKQ